MARVVLKWAAALTGSPTGWRSALARLGPSWMFKRWNTAGRAELPSGHDLQALFNPNWYLAQYTDVARSGLDPLTHYLEHGAAEGRDPSPLFDTDWYIAQYPDVAESGLNPLVHYLEHGAAEGRDPSPKDPGFILDNLLNNADLTAASRLFEAMDPDALTGAPVRTIMGELKDVHGFATREGQLLADGQVIEAALSGGVSRHFSLGNDPLAAGSLPQLYVAELKDVLVHPGSSTIVNAAGQALHDEFSRLMDRPDAQPKLPNLKLTRDGKLMIRFRHKAFPALECGVHLCSERTPNYFDWVTNTLPRMLVIEQLRVDPKIPVLVPASLDEIFFELLDFVRHPERPVLRLEEPYLYRVRRLIYPSSPYPPLITPSTMGSDTSTSSDDLIRALIAQVKAFLPDDQRDVTRRLYVRETGHQRPKNAELEYFLVTRGFELVNVEGISARARIALFSQASKVVVPLGAEMTDIIWCEPQTQVLALGPNRSNTDLSCWANLAKAANVDFSLTPGSDPQGRNAFSQSDSSTVDLELLQRSIEILLGSSHR